MRSWTMRPSRARPETTLRREARCGGGVCACRSAIGQDLGETALAGPVGFTHTDLPRLEGAASWIACRLHDLVELSRAELGSTARARGRAVVDYVAGMTDRFACQQAVGLLNWDPARLPEGVDTFGLRR